MSKDRRRSDKPERLCHVPTSAAQVAGPPFQVGPAEPSSIDGLAGIEIKRSANGASSNLLETKPVVRLPRTAVRTTYTRQADRIADRSAVSIHADRANDTASATHHYGEPRLPLWRASPSRRICIDFPCEAGSIQGRKSRSAVPPTRWERGRRPVRRRPSQIVAPSPRIRSNCARGGKPARDHGRPARQYPSSQAERVRRIRSRWHQSRRSGSRALSSKLPVP